MYSTDGEESYPTPPNNLPVSITTTGCVHSEKLLWMHFILLSGTPSFLYFSFYQWTVQWRYFGQLRDETWMNALNLYKMWLGCSSFKGGTIGSPVSQRKKNIYRHRENTKQTTHPFKINTEGRPSIESIRAPKPHPTDNLNSTTSREICLRCLRPVKTPISLLIFRS